MMDFLKVFRPIASDFLSTIAFLVVLVATDNIVLATSVGIAMGVGQFLWLRVRGTPIALMQVASVALVVVLGAATILTRDARFMMLKPSIAGAAIATVMMQRGWQLRYFPPPVKENIAERALVVWGYVWAALYYLLSAANLVVALRYGRHVWEAFTAFVPTAAPIALFVFQYVWIRAAVIRTVRARSVGSQTELSPAE